MTANANSVNIAPERAYHHGDLRAALIETGLDMLGESAADELSLRELARRVGVSATAVYRHFPDKRALLTALAFEGYEALGRKQQAASRAAGGGVEGFVAAGVAYVDFATENPALFRLAFTHVSSVLPLDAADAETSLAMQALRDDVEALSPPGTPEPIRRAAALTAWSLVHGLAMLVLDGQVANDRTLIERVVRNGCLTWLGR